MEAQQAPKTAPAPAAQKPDPQADLAKAQAEARAKQRESHLGALLSDAGDLILGRGSQMTDIAKRGEDEANQGVKDLLQRREAERQAAQDKQAADLNDENSAVSQLATKLGQARGLVRPGQKISANQWNLVKDAGSMDEAKARLDAEAERQKAELDARAKEGSANRANAYAIAKLAAQTKEDIHGGAAKKLGDQEMVKLKNYENAIRGLDQLSDAYKHETAIGPSGGRYEDLRDQLKGTLAAANAPNARENVQLMEEAKNETPDRFTRSSRGNAQFANKRQQLLDNYRTFVEGLKGSGYDVSGFNPDKFASPASGPHGQTVTQNGHTYTWNPSTGKYE